jgi:hypothetical protein
MSLCVRLTNQSIEFSATVDKLTVIFKIIPVFSVKLLFIIKELYIQ